MAKYLGLLAAAVVTLSQACPASDALGQTATSAATSQTASFSIALRGPTKPGEKVDYIAWLNEKYGQGVTKENNAAVKIIQALGPNGFIRYDIHEETLHRLGIVIEGTPHYFTHFRPSDEKARTAYDAAHKSIWHEADHPDIARWLKDNEEPLAKMLDASNCPRYYMPQIRGAEDPPLFSIAIPTLTSIREVGRVLIIRANLELDQGKFEDARRDVLAVFRLGSLAGQDPTLVGRLVGVAIDRLASSAVQNWATSGQLTSAQATQLIHDIQTLPPLASMAGPINEMERYMVLDTVVWVATREKADDESTPDQRLDRVGRDSAGVQSAPSSLPASGPADHEQQDPFAAGLPGFKALKMVGHDVPETEIAKAVSMVNQFYDEQVAATKASTFAQLIAATDKLRSERDQLSIEAGRLAERDANQVLQTPGWFGSITAPPFISTLGRAEVIRRLAGVSRDLSIVSLALAAYHADNGSYPQRLYELAPKYLKEVPKDFCSGNDFIYRPQGDGYLLYSVGDNMTDDGGDETNHNDIVVRKQGN